ncbi:Lrp/AsnC family transcriptional regulator [Siculibacillus lacustris]|uniref:Lrp/AsnC family transcriptional regulator n=1 Tax=Siculibacillus lacustris TaxID=1549641 RepID=A0A4Q9VYU5_9HYPH|nr:Lrp/AsnC family transcriptional regulator [Siculibacillus lacustris]TBW41354.1 Lrp/AsnC family transcriptional regulator [Siculibacillus lacustris]
MKDSFTEIELDRVDRRILHLLQGDGRMANADLAEAVHVSPATCHRRVRRLVEAGCIRGFRAEIEPRAVDRGTLVIVGVELDRSTPESFADFATAVRRLPFVLDCHLVAGDFDFFLKIRVRDIADFNRLHGELLIALPGVRQTRTFFVMKEIIDAAALDF